MNANVLKSLDYIKDELKRGIIDSTEANIRLVEAERFRIVRNKLSREVRSALSQGVKQGRLVRVLKTEKNPEYYYKPNFEYLVKEQLYKEECILINSLKSICR